MDDCVYIYGYEFFGSDGQYIIIFIFISLSPKECSQSNEVHFCQNQTNGKTAKL